MGDNIIIPKPEPLFPKQVQVDSPLMSAHETHMAMQTTGLWHQGTRGVRSWFWGTPAIAPLTNFASGSFTTDLRFRTSDGTGEMVSSLTTGVHGLRLAWYVHPRVERIWCKAVLAHDVTYPIYFMVQGGRLSLGDTISAVMSPDSERSDKCKTSGPLNGAWAAGMQNYGYNTFTHLTTALVPNVPSNPTHRRISIQPFVHWGLGLTFPINNGSLVVTVRIVSLEIWEELEVPV